MSLLQRINSWLSGSKAPAAANDNDLFFQRQAALKAYQTARAQEFAQLVEGVKRLGENHSSFENFLFRPDFDHFLRTEVLVFSEPDDPNAGFLATSHWRQKHPFNFPGPFYTGESDSCGTGIVEAPVNVGNDSYGCEYVFRQPSTFEELADVLHAGATEVLTSYSSNGNECWTYAACKAWWRDRETIVRALQDPEVVRSNNGQDQLYLRYLRGAAEMDLRRYCFFLENGVYPSEPSAVLPEL